MTKKGLKTLKTRHISSRLIVTWFQTVLLFLGIWESHFTRKSSTQVFYIYICIADMRGDDGAAYIQRLSPCSYKMQCLVAMCIAGKDIWYARSIPKRILIYTTKVWIVPVKGAFALPPHLNVYKMGYGVWNMSSEGS